MIKGFLNRIPKSINLNEVCKEICVDFKLGNFLKYEIVLTGREDLNIILITSNNKYFIKIFNKRRTDKECRILTNINLQLLKNGVNCPKLFSYNKNKFLYQYKKGSHKILLIVQQFIDGENFYVKNTTPNNNEIKTIVKQISKIQKTKDIKKEYIYDPWYLGNIVKEFNERKHVLLQIEINILLKLIETFNKIDFNKYPKRFVHGDFTKENVIKDKNGKIWFIDFSVSNIYPRILEIVVVNTHLIIDYSNDKKTTLNRNLVVREYEKNVNLTSIEKNSLADLELVAYGIEYMICVYELRKDKNNSEENIFYIKSSIRGLLESKILTDEERSFLLSPDRLK